MLIYTELDQLLGEVSQRARDAFGGDLDAVILYGSYARGDAGPESDVDIMLLVRQSIQALSRQGKSWDHFGTGLDLKYGVLTSFSLQDAETFYAWKDTLPFFRNIVKEGVFLRD